MAKTAKRLEPTVTHDLTPATDQLPALRPAHVGRLHQPPHRRHPRRRHPAQPHHPPLPQPRLRRRTSSRTGPRPRAASPCPQHEFGLDVIALVGRLRYAEHRSVPEIHADLVRRGRGRSPSAPSPTCWTATTSCSPSPSPTTAGCGRCWPTQGRVILAIDGLQPDVGHEVLWVLRDVPHRRGPAGQEPAVGPAGGPGRAAAAGEATPARCRSPGWSPTASTRSARRWPRPCPACRTSSASSTTCARRPGRSTRPTATPRRN